MNHQGTKTIQTKRLILRRLELTDVTSLFEVGCLGQTKEEAVNIVDDMMKYYINNNNYNWGIEYNRKIIGRIKVNEISSRDNYVQLGYDIGLSYRNKGLMTEAVKGVIAFLFNKVGVHRIYGQCRIHNIASARVMQKAGMLHEGRLRKHFIECDGTYSDVDVYGIIKEEFKIVSPL